VYVRERWSGGKLFFLFLCQLAVCCV